MAKKTISRLSVLAVLIVFLYIGSIKYVHNVTYWFLFLELIWSRIRAANS